MILDETTLRKLKQLSLVASRIRAGAIKGERRSTRRGSSVEFADYRNYAPGDDLRRLDWNLFARLEKPFIKLLEEEEDLAVHILVDGSTSMGWGSEEMHKFRYALRVCAAISTIALSSGDNLTVALLSDGKIRGQYGPVRGQQHLIPMFKFIEAQTSNGKTALGAGINEYQRSNHRPGMVFLISDLLSREDWPATLRQLLSQGHECILIHLLAPDEIDPPLSGDLRLVDSETGQGQEVSLDAGLRQLYRNQLQTWRDEIQKSCYKKGVQYLFTSTAHPWDQLVTLNFRQAGIVR